MFNFKKLLKLFKKHLFLIIFICVIFFIGLIAIAKLLIDNSQTIYVKAKVAQGLWWVSTVQPNMWYIDSIKPGLKQKSLSGKPIAEITDVHYYPSNNPDEYSVYITVKLKADFNKRTGVYKFERDNIAVAGPIAFEFPTVFINATVMDISKKPYNETLLEKTITLEKKWGRQLEYDAIQVGDEYHDGKETVLKILSKDMTDVYASYSSLGNNYPIDSEPNKNVIVKVKIKLNNKNGNLFYGEEQLVYPGKRLNISTSQFRFEDFIVMKIE